MRQLVLLLVAVAAVSAATAQPSREEVDARPAIVIPTMTTYSGTIYTSAEAVAPKGYEPFYMTGYLRHGSRYESRDKYPVETRNYFRAAAEHNLLTPLGRRVKEYMDNHYDIHDKRIGDLTRIGYEQHLGIGRRLGRRFPTLFKDGATVASIASMRMRSTMSMVAFFEGLKEQNPRLRTDMVSSEEHAAIVRPQDPKANAHYPAAQHGAYEQFVHDSIRRPINRWADSSLDFSHAWRAMFTEPDKFCALFPECHPLKLLTDIYKRLSFEQNIRPEATLELVQEVFTADERYNIYRIENAVWYYRCASAAYPTLARSMSEHRVLFDHITSLADKAIAGHRSEVADLRFGHDYYLIPIASILGIDGQSITFGRGKELDDNVEAAVNRAAELWRGYKITPKAGNVLLVLYRSTNANGDTLVRVLLNERDVELPLLKAVVPHFYKWQDVKELIYRQLDRIDRLAEAK